MGVSRPRVEYSRRPAFMWSAVLTAGAWLLPFGAAGADIYMVVDEYGVTHVTNVPKPDTARRGTRRAALYPLPASRPGAETSIRERSKRYSEIVDVAAREHRIDAALIHAVIRAESNYNATVISPKGAIGLMQLMPTTARRYGVADPRDATQNIQGGVRYLRDLLDMFHHNLALALAAYNAGENAVLRHGGVPPYAETTNYVVRVLDFYLQPSLYQDPDLSIARSKAE